MVTDGKCGRTNGPTGMKSVLRCLVVFVLGWASGLALYAQPSQTLSIAADSPRWDLQQQAKVAEHLGRKCLVMEGGAAVLKDFEMRDGVLDVDVATAAERGFFGFDV